MNGLIEINNNIRHQVINLENIRIKVIELRAESNTEQKLKDRIEEYIKNSISSLLILSELSSDAESCHDDSDLEILLGTASWMNITDYDK
jgi:hypothetical protein